MAPGAPFAARKGESGNDMINGVTNTMGLDVLERMVQFTAARHEVIANNVANLSTPGYQAQDLSVEAFQGQLADAIDQRRSGKSNADMSLRPANTSQVEFLEGGMNVRPEAAGHNILFHDKNDRSLERTMQDLVKNFMTFRASAQLLRNRFDILHTAIAERV